MPSGGVLAAPTHRPDDAFTSTGPRYFLSTPAVLMRTAGPIGTTLAAIGLAIADDSDLWSKCAFAEFAGTGIVRCWNWM